MQLRSDVRGPRGGTIGYPRADADRSRRTDRGSA